MPRYDVKTPDPLRGSALGVYGSVQHRPEYLFGTDEEVRARINEGYRTHGTDPSGVPSEFRAIRPGPTSLNANEPQPRSYGGTSKVGNPRRYA